ncbi:RanBP2-type zinc finger protein family [Quillaja saponaria]|uniref:RanBP2-type zinc finger protein family n=1 Tax=Quillaja saponaria TaxID=32244 RepID=A0AAD7PP45_QUISA|nr:RanBP2-type zinc finger protein family [Quillaja saponaria]
MGSTMADNRGSFGPKRSRNDASRNDGDWTCPKCGNVNFSFRNVCNRGNCGVPRQPVSPPAPITSPYNHCPPFYFGGIGAPPLPYGVPGRYGSPVPHSGLHYDYGLLASPHGSYAPVSPFPHGSFRGISYGPMPTTNGYGYTFQGPPWAEGIIPDNFTSRKRRGGPDSLNEGDWICPKCDNVNFAFRTVCNMKKCGAARPSGPNQSNNNAPEGSWTCSKCGNLNYPFRTVCNRKECGNVKPASGK